MLDQVHHGQLVREAASETVHSRCRDVAQLSLCVCRCLIVVLLAFGLFGLGALLMSMAIVVGKSQLGKCRHFLVVDGVW